MSAPLQIGAVDPGSLGRDRLVAVAAHDRLALAAWSVREGEDSTVLVARLRDGALVDAAPIAIARDAGTQVAVAARDDGFLVVVWLHGAGLRAIPVARDGTIGAAREPPPPIALPVTLTTAGAGYVLSDDRDLPAGFPATGESTLTWLAADGTALTTTTTTGRRQALMPDRDGVGLAALEDTTDGDTGTRALGLRTITADGAARDGIPIATASYTREEHTTCEASYR